MSSAKDCGKHAHDHDWSWSWGDKKTRRILKCLLFFVLLILFTILIIYLALHPHKPKFYLQNASVRSFNLTSSDSLTTDFQFTVLSHNPNDKIAVIYDDLAGYVVYYGQPITTLYNQPPLYQAKCSDLSLPFKLSGNSVPVAPLLLSRLNYEVQNGVVNVHLLLNGRVRWEVGSWTSNHYHLNVDCEALLSSTAGDFYNGAISLQPGGRCSVDV